MTRLVVLAIVVALLAIPGVSSTAVAAKPKCNGLVATKVGSNKSQVIRGTDKPDVIVAKGGVDRIFGEGGNDVICAGPGNDVIVGGPGKDRIFGEGGNDVLKGGPGKDLLDGGSGRDGCYPAAGDDRLRKCEDADLAVSIVVTSPTPLPGAEDGNDGGGIGGIGGVVAADGETIELTVRVRNLGAKRSGPYDLGIEQVETNVDCAVDLSGTSSYESLWPGAFNAVTYTIEDGCTATPGILPSLTVRATVEPASPDADVGNDQAEARIDFGTSLSLPTADRPSP